MNVGRYASMPCNRMVRQCSRLSRLSRVTGFRRDLNVAGVLTHSTCNALHGRHVFHVARDGMLLQETSREWILGPPPTARLHPGHPGQPGGKSRVERIRVVAASKDAFAGTISRVHM